MEQAAFSVEWIDRHREPQCQPNPSYPNGMDADLRTDPSAPSCVTEVPYPAKRCGVYLIECKICGIRVGVTTAGRPDDPRTVRVPCKIVTAKQ